MKKLFVFLAAIFILSSTANAQELGLRYGEVTAGKWAIDGVFSVSSLKRVHADLSLDNGLGLDGIWDFVYNRIKNEAIYYYVGVGAFMYIETTENENQDDKFFLGFLGEAGLEYRFRNAPIAIGIDWRPSFKIIDKTKFSVGGFGLNVRFVF
jgi:hypothetical protein